MRIFHKCHFCNHSVWPWQRESPTDISGSHYSCHKAALDISRKYRPEDSAMLDAEIGCFERRTGCITGFKSQQSEAKYPENRILDAKRYAEQSIKIAEEKAATFPDQPTHKRHLEGLNKHREWVTIFRESLQSEAAQ